MQRPQINWISVQERVLALWRLPVPSKPVALMYRHTPPRGSLGRGAGFLGSYVVEKLRGRGCSDVFLPRSKDHALTQLPAVQRLYGDTRPDIVIHPSTPLRAGSGGAGVNRSGVEVAICPLIRSLAVESVEFDGIQARLVELLGVVNEDIGATRFRVNGKVN